MVTAGRNASVVIQTRDRFYNDATSGGEFFEAFLITTDPIARHNRTVVDLNNGRYFVSYILTASGEYGLELKRAGSAIPGSPFMFTLLGAHTDPQKTIVTGAGINGGVVNVFAQFDVTLYDSFGNRRNQGGEPVTPN